MEPLLRAIRSEGYTTPTPIQLQAIPHVLEGKDLLGCAQTGTGKTAAFALPILHRLHLPAQVPLHGGSQLDAAGHGKEVGHASAHARVAAGGKASPSRPIRAMILTPTRELAAQIGESFSVYGRHTRLRHTVIFGGVGQGPQAQALRQGVDILVATPGRLLDLLNQRLLSLKNIEIFVLDEADRMLDMGFIHDIRRVIALLPERRQTLMFSATMPQEIRKLASTILHGNVEVRVAAQSAAADTVEQCLYFVDSHNKPALLEHLLKAPDMTRTLVFTRTKHGADKVVKRLVKAGITSEAIHANKSQNARLRALKNFKSGSTSVLVASDIAARGLDVDNISHVVNYDLPNEPETYVHRIGRTGRAGASGNAISFACGDQRDELRDIERLLGRPIPVLKCPIKLAPPPAESQLPRQASRHGGQHRIAAGGGHGAGKTATPEQQQAAFWQRKRRPAVLTGKPRGRRR